IVKCTHLPVTVKTRLGWDNQSRNIVEVAERLQDIGIKALTVHGRTRVQMYKGAADWTLIGKIKENPRMTIPVFGNGDIDSPQMAVEYRNRYGVDGIMVGRAAIGYPWIFNEIKHYIKFGERPAPPEVGERIRAVKKHLDFSMRWKGDRLGIFEMRKHYNNYFRGIADFKPFRMRLVEANDVEEVLRIFDEICDRYEVVAVN
ncbi:MAG TPA: tRNA-dihydrouridine synthase, partial [Chryseosolibacter sp.]|nr:tRNA-dihydrouridine synthase [Chryseosolibacter sp.]